MVVNPTNCIHRTVRREFLLGIYPAESWTGSPKRNTERVAYHEAFVCDNCGKRQSDVEWNYYAANLKPEDVRGAT
jgi:hypothetical protein